MATTRPEASDRTGTLRAISGVTAPVTINSEAAGRAAASASGNCSGRSTVNRLTSTPGTMWAGGGAWAARSASLLQPQIFTSNGAQLQIRIRLALRSLLLMGTVQSVTTYTPVRSSSSSGYTSCSSGANHPL